MKEKRIEKEIKKAQKKGIYNPKLKLGIVGLILVIGTVIGVSYAYYTKTATNTLTISGTVSKKITVTVQSGGNGTVSGSPQTVDYGTQATFTVQPNEGYQYKSVSCNYNSSTSHSGNTLYITPRTSKDVTCTVTFGEETVKIFDREYKVTQGNPNFSTGCPTREEDECSGVYRMKDYGNTSNLNPDNPGGISYYFRGEVKNNYVKFGKGTIKNNTEQQDLIWRIVRINGDGTIRLVLDSDIGTSAFNNTANARKYVGYTYGNSKPCTNTSPCISNYSSSSFTKSGGIGTDSIIKTKLENWYRDNLSSLDTKIALTTFCNDTSYGSGDETEYLYYGAYERLYKSSNSATPQLTCPDPITSFGISTPSESSEHTGTGFRTYGGVYKLKIGLLSADEIVLAGFKPNSNGVTTSNYLYYNNASDNYFWSSSPQRSDASIAYVFHGHLISRYLSYNDVTVIRGVRPVINLKTEGLTVTGEGTKNSPFVIS